MSKAGLNEKQKAFCREYLVDLNATKSAIRAGYSQKTAGSQAFDLLQKPEIQAFISELMKEREKRTGITSDRVVQELAKIGFASMRHFIRIDGDGQPQIDLSFTDDDNLDALAEVQTETLTETRGRGESKEVDVIRKTKIKLHDKLGALKELAEHTGVFAKRDADQVNALALALQQVFARGSKAPIRRDGDK